MPETELCGRRGLAEILGVTERWTLDMQAAGLIAPEMLVDGRYPVFSVRKAKALRDKRAAARAAESRKRVRTQANPADAV